MHALHHVPFGVNYVKNEDLVVFTRASRLNGNTDKEKQRNDLFRAADAAFTISSGNCKQQNIS